jgi:hypothetical protein
MPPTLEQLAAQVEALTALLAWPDIVPNWDVRTCQECGEPAVVIDSSTATRAMVRNGEGYCLTHATAAGVLDGDHLTR